MSAVDEAISGGRQVSFGRQVDEVDETPTHFTEFAKSLIINTYEKKVYTTSHPSHLSGESLDVVYRFRLPGSGSWGRSCALHSIAPLGAALRRRRAACRRRLHARPLTMTPADNFCLSQVRGLVPFCAEGMSACCVVSVSQWSCGSLTRTRLPFHALARRLTARPRPGLRWASMLQAAQPTWSGGLGWTPKILTQFG
jgi:hypothetical protein